MTADTSTDDGAVLSGRGLSAREQLDLNTINDIVRTDLDHLYEVTRHLTTLASVMLGGGLVFLDPSLLNVGWKNAVSMAFLIALVISAYGLLPFSRQIDLGDLDAVRGYLNDARAHRLQLVRAGCAFLLLGFLLALIGMNVTALTG